MADQESRFLSASTHFSDPAFPLSVSEAKVGHNDVRAHKHDFIEAVYVHKGRGQHHMYALDGNSYESYPIIAGDIFLIAADRQHAYYDNHDLVVYNIIFQAEIFGDAAAALSSMPGLIDFLIMEPLFREEDQFKRKLHLAPQQARSVQEQLQQIICELTQKELGYQLSAKSLFIQLLVQLGRYFSAQKGSAELSDDGRQRAIEQAIRYMESNYNESLSLDEIATQVFLSPNYFSELFKRRVGVAPWEYVTQLRLDEACALLKQTDRSITDIALSTGFSDSSYFSKIFKERFAQTPSQYRKALNS